MVEGGGGVSQKELRLRSLNIRREATQILPTTLLPNRKSDRSNDAFSLAAPQSAVFQNQSHKVKNAREPMCACDFSGLWVCEASGKPGADADKFVLLLPRKVDAGGKGGGGRAFGFDVGIERGGSSESNLCGGEGRLGEQKRYHFSCFSFVAPRVRAARGRLFLGPSPNSVFV